MPTALMGFTLRSVTSCKVSRRSCHNAPTCRFCCVLHLTDSSRVRSRNPQLLGFYPCRKPAALTGEPDITTATPLGFFPFRVTQRLPWSLFRRNSSHVLYQNCRLTEIPICTPEYRSASASCRSHVTEATYRPSLPF